MNRMTALTLLWLFTLSSARAEETRATVRAVRQDIDTIREEIKQTEPYPGGQRWVGRLRSLETRLARAGDGDARRFRWFGRAIADFGERKKDDALVILEDLSRRLALLEDTLPPQRGEQEQRSAADVKSLLRGTEGRKVERGRRRSHVEEERREVRREEVRREEPPADGAPAGGGGGGGPAVSVPAGGGGGLSLLGWLLLGGLALAVVVVGLYLYLSAPRSPRTPKPSVVSGKEAPAPDHDARQVLEESPAALWRQADTLADAGRFREAVRVLYLAVLALLHQRRLIRFEATRTNGEYVRQVRLSEQAPPELHEPFQRLTDLFETVWYGERSCAAEDYRGFRALADQTRQLVPSA
jgi:hypothetical protein